MTMHAYRTHKCGQLTKKDEGQTVKLSGWIHRKRDHGGVLFIDLRDTTGLTQCVVDQDSPQLQEIEKWRPESVITIEGRVKARHPGTENAKMTTGDIEVYIDNAILQSAADVLPLQVADEDNAGEDIRLKYRFLDLRREGMHSRIRLRNNVIASMRRRMWDQGFQEFNTPILTASSPEGARDYLVPSRLHPGKFYALPQAPQQFKQLLMVSGFDRYFQIAPCFRDEDGRADRLAEFYQLDVEMAFVTQEEIFATMTPVIDGVFKDFANWTGTDHRVEWLPNLTYADAMSKYGSDKPDLRNPLIIVDVTEVFAREDVTFNAFKGVLAKGGVVKAIRAPGVAGQPRSFFDKLNDWARGEGAAGLGYIQIEGGEGKGPIAKFVPAEALAVLKNIAGLQDGDAIFFACDLPEKAAKFAGKARDRICDDMGVREKGVYKFCWVVDFPMYEMDEKSGTVDFSHNPFSMPQGGMDSLETKNPLDILANQYDCVCNGFELASGGIRNHKAEIMEKAFAIAGYGKDVLEKKFGGMLNAFRYGAPPHGGCAFGIDRIVMLLANEPNLREVYAFVMNGAYEDQMMQAPSDPTPEQLRDLHLKVVMPVKVETAEKKTA
ncbi:Aspartyl-tRNA synthetase / Aspartyl-tRNA(Asn) synthetase [Micavibrio aeruginosavorus EPB]|uniref:Aspartate--tRNA(Asp/Asn) ligase n=2 Tax=Micavibrio aeruginosavorus TaxID=349221 RepID=M4VZQ8_9BACT|nr:aspartate--tRNA ligase [Micavibrio aeruginosavorus]AGH98674.1 Aspartyl-tRNA synthetase / Aspartyl-tRNA(Asn) synthetase [Micavibrio aeruginosavorus EPB]